jgi:hypothetical protein
MGGTAAAKCLADTGSPVISHAKIKCITAATLSTARPTPASAALVMAVPVIIGAVSRVLLDG